MDNNGIRDVLRDIESDLSSDEAAAARELDRENTLLAAGLGSREGSRLGVGSRTSISSTRRDSKDPEGQSQQCSPPPPHTAGFWDRTPFMAGARKSYMRVLSMGFLLTSLVIFGVLSIFWGSLWRTNLYVHKLDGWIVVSAYR